MRYLKNVPVTGCLWDASEEEKSDYHASESKLWLWKGSG